MPDETDFNQALDAATGAIRSAQPDRAATEAAASRVWQRLSAEMEGSMPEDSGRAIAGCADVQALLPAYRAGKLPQAREWLVQDHLRECVNCRNAAQGARGAVVLPWREPVKADRTIMTTARKFAWAAAVLFVAGSSLYLFRDRFLPSPAGERATLEWSQGGPVYVANAQGQRVLAPNGVVNEQEWVRTPTGTRAMLRLRDGSHVELNERAEMAVAVNRTDTTLRLERGTVLVQAARRRTGHLLVNSNDATVSVTGTVFAVNRGVKGTRVSVVEGEVLVDQRGRTDTLHAGDQVATNQLLEPVEIKDEIAWSRNKEQHLKLLAELNEISKRLKTIQLPGLRYQTLLLQSLPANTIVYASIPNLGDALAQAERIFADRLSQSTELRAWWDKNALSKAGPSLEELTGFVRGISEYLGEEVSFVVVQDSDNQPQFAAVAAVRRPGIQAFIDSNLSKFNVKQRPAMMVTDSLVVIAPEAKTLQAFASGGLAVQPFGQKIAESFRDGVTILFCADLSRMSSKPEPVIQKLGADDVRYLVVAERDYNGHNETRATLNFAGPRHGIASWLGAPGTMGSLDFVSQNATVAASFVLKSPALLFDDLMALGTSSGSRFQEEIAKAEAQAGVRLRDDFAASLGNDVTVSVDGPLLPVPAWKVAVEVRDPARMQQALTRLFAAVQLKVESKETMGRTVYTIAHEGKTLQYAFSDGYLVVVPDGEGMQRALRTHDGGWSLARSSSFRSLLPADRQSDFSAVVYHNLGDVAQVLRDTMDAAGGKLPPEQKELMQRFSEMKPGLIYAYGLENQIQVASTASFLGMTIDKLLDANSMASLVKGASVMNLASAGRPQGMNHGPDIRFAPKFRFAPKRNNP